MVGRNIWTAKLRVTWVLKKLVLKFWQWVYNCMNNILPLKVYAFESKILNYFSVWFLKVSLCSLTGKISNSFLEVGTALISNTYVVCISLNTKIHNTVKVKTVYFHTIMQIFPTQLKSAASKQAQSTFFQIILSLQVLNTSKRLSTKTTPSIWIIVYIVMGLFQNEIHE